MFATGMSYMSMSFFSAASMTISIFSAIQVFAWVATLWTGTPVLATPLLFTLGFLAALVIGGLNGIVTAVIPFDWQLTDTYFVVSHLHYVLVGTNMFPVFAGLYYWFPKMTGRMLDERLGAWSFWLIFIGFNVAFFPMQVMGIQGMPRRLYTYPAGLGWESLNLTATVGAAILTVGIVISLWNFLVSRRYGAVAGKDPWHADTLEWSLESPPAPYGSVHLPTVRSRHPLWDDHDEEYDPQGERILDQGRLTLTTSWLDAEPRSLATMPESTVTPLLLALAFAALFTAFLLKALWVALAAIVISLAIVGTWLWPEPEPHPV
jgi:heme/copper-type cytochrome/quinol oxidase subunit 1